MCVRGTNPNPAQLSGHALMFSCPPDRHYHENPNDEHYHELPDISNPELMKLLALSYDLPLNGEMAPVQALQIIRTHERARELTLQDFQSLTARLFKYMNCYGWVAPCCCAQSFPVAPSDPRWKQCAHLMSII